MNEREFEQLLQEKIAALPQEMEPERDLWPGIDLALEDQARHSAGRMRRSAIAASISLFGIIGLFSLYNLNEQQRRWMDPAQLVNNMSAQHEDHKQLLLTRYQQQPALTDNWQEQLQELDAAATAIKSALQEDPGDAELIRLLQQIYQQQIKLIQAVHREEWL